MDESGRQKFGAYLRKLREDKKLAQKAASAQAGISSPYLAQLEKGQRNPPSRSILSKLAKVYDIAPQELWQEAEYADRKVQRLYSDLNPIRVNWAFQAMLDDPDYSFGTRIRGQELTLEAKAMLVEIYQKSMNRQLLTPKELEPEEAQEEVDGEPESISGNGKAGD